MQSGFIKLDSRLPQVDNNVNSFWYNGETGPGYKAAGPGYTGVGSLGQPLLGWASFTPAEIFQETTTQGVQRCIGSVERELATVQLVRRPRRRRSGSHRSSGHSTLPRWTVRRLRHEPTWLRDRRTSEHTQLHSEPERHGVVEPEVVGRLQDDGRRAVRQLRSRSRRVDRLDSSAGRPDAVTGYDAGDHEQRRLLSKTLGVFVEEQAAIRDRLFLTAAVRTDQNSAFGTNFQRVYYPKASLSWVDLRRELLPELRMAQLAPRALVVGSVGRAARSDRRASHAHDGAHQHQWRRHQRRAHEPARQPEPAPREVDRVGERLRLAAVQQPRDVRAHLLR